MAIVDLHNEMNIPVRSRSLYTAHSCTHDETFRNNAQYLEENLAPAEYFNLNNWQQRNGRGQNLVTYYTNDELYQPWEVPEISDLGDGAYKASATSHGTISLKLRDCVRVEMTVDGAIRVVNPKQSVLLGLSASGAATALIHPQGKVYHYGARVEIQARHPQGCYRFAKMWYKGVSFTTEQSASVYLVDAAGTRTTVDSFLDLSQDMTLVAFYSGSRHGPYCVDEALSRLCKAQYWVNEDGTDNWVISGVYISQTADGFVRIRRDKNQYQVRTSPSNGSVTITTPHIHCTASLGQTQHMFVRKGERRMHFDGSTFIVRNAGHSAGFDDVNQLKIY